MVSIDKQLDEVTNGRGVVGQLQYYQQVIEQSVSGLKNVQDVFDVKLREITASHEKLMTSQQTNRNSLVAKFEAVELRLK